MSIFNSVPTFKPPKVNKFNLSDEVLTTAELGNIYPVKTQMMLPKTYFKVSPACVVKTAPMYAPIYSGVKVNFAAFAVPMRLLWDKFPEWIYDPQNTTDLPPHISEELFKTLLIESSTHYNHSLAGDFDAPVVQAIDDHIDTKSTSNGIITIQDFLAYHLIWQEYFRNENLQPESAFNADTSLQNYDSIVSDDVTDDEDNDIAFTGMDYFLRHRRCNYSKDYFTSALPTPQKGMQTFLSVLQSNTAPVIFSPGDNINPYDTALIFNGADAQPPLDPFHVTAQAMHLENGYADIDFHDHTYTQQLDVYTDLSNAAAGISVSDFRALFAVQSYMEQLNVGGGRYKEGTKTFYDCYIKDSRAQRPEFLGIDSTYVMPQEVVAHEPDSLGQLGAYGQAVGGGRSFRYFATEHTVFMIVMYLKPKSLYMQGLPKSFRLSDQFSYPIQLFQHLGEEEVEQEEIFYDGNDTNDHSTFGYQSRFAYWRSSRDRIRGDFTTTLRDWHLARIFNAAPALNDAFIQVNAGPVSQNGVDYIKEDQQLNRVFNFTGSGKYGADHFWINIYFNMPAKLPLQYHSKPMLVG